MGAIGCRSTLKVGAVGASEGGSGYWWVWDNTGWAVSA